MRFHKGLVIFFSSVFFLWASLSMGRDISTNSITSQNVPSWLTENAVNRVVDSIQKYMEWDIRKVTVSWYTNAETFRRFHGFDDSVQAVSKKEDNSIHMGPRVNQSSFDSVFGHELVHIILFQKYKAAIPPWLEEGLANFVAKKDSVDYPWLAGQPYVNVQSLVHPFLNRSAKYSSARLAGGLASGLDPRFHYQASTAVVEMIASKCSLNDLLQLSVGEKLVNYLSTFCQITDVNADLKKWIEKKAGLSRKH